MNVYDVSDRFQGGYTDRRTVTRYLTVHHAAANYTRTDTGLEDVAAIATFHTDKPPKGRGWPGIGYHEVLAEETPNGPIACYIVSDPNLQRAHVALLNDKAFGICAAANFTGVPAQKWIDAFAERLRVRRKDYPGATIVGHGDIALAGYQTQCPGPMWRAWKDRLVAAVETPDYEALWGQYAPYVPTWGIPTRWRHEHTVGRPLGMAIAPEFVTPTGLTVQAFERGFVTWSSVAGARVWREQP